MLRKGNPPFEITLILVFWIMLSPGTAVAENRIVIDTQKAILTVLNEYNNLLLSVEDISIGRFGARRGKILGDGMTPLGNYRIISIRKSKRFHYYVELDYPSVADAALGLSNGTITSQQAQTIRFAHSRGIQPPQNTPLGGHIGLHGIGNGDPEIHQQYNWTRGCIAMTDQQIEQLLPLIKVGIRTTIK